MTALERLWKYTVLGATSIIGEETNPILGGIAVRHGRADLAAVIIVITLGTWIASLGLYYVGLWRIGWVRRRWPEKHKLLDSALAIVERHPWGSSFAVRFAYGLRLPVPIACGAARLPIGLYASASFISCLVWSAAFTYLGLAFAGVALRLLHFTSRLDVKLGFLAVVLGGVLAFLIRRRIASERALAASKLV